MTLGIESKDQRYLARIKEALVDELYQRSAIPQFLFAPVLFLLYLLLQDVIARRPAIAWVFAGIVLVLLPRSLAILNHRRLRKRFPQPHIREWFFAIGAALVGVGLGLINLLAAKFVSVEQVAMLALIAAGTSSVNIVSMNPSLRSYFLSMLPNFGTIPILIWIGPEMVHRNIYMVLVIINVMAVTIMATYMHINGCKAILLRIKVDDAKQSLAQRNQELESLNERLADTQSQLLQSEKMASIGQLAAGVAHEINNPIAFVRANLHSLDGYAKDILSALDIVDRTQGVGRDAAPQAFDTAFLREDIPALLTESIEGVTRVEKIVKDLREFSHLDESDWQKVDLHRGIETTISVAAHELRYRIEIIRHYGELPLVECLPFQINQVLLNLLVNAAQSIAGHGHITLSTGHDGDDVWIKVADTGKGIEPQHLKRIFEPFFTTKPVGIGTGLGLSVSYSIVRRHGGSIEATSVLGEGTTFTVRLPVVGQRLGSGEL